VEYDEGITTGLSPDGRTGWMILRADDVGPGVLAHVDTATLRHDQEQSTDGPSATLVHSATEVSWRRIAGLDGPSRTLIVVECKAPGVTLSEEVKGQGIGYAEQRRARYVVLTSGLSGQTRSYVGT